MLSMYLMKRACLVPTLITDVVHVSVSYGNLKTTLYPVKQMLSTSGHIHHLVISKYVMHRKHAPKKKTGP
jgi:predicted rRNA methylase YqxC with S4 and FtsJ domains